MHWPAAPIVSINVHHITNELISKKFLNGRGREPAERKEVALAPEPPPYVYLYNRGKGRERRLARTSPGRNYRARRLISRAGAAGDRGGGGGRGENN